MSEWRKVKFLDLFALPSRNGLTKPSRVRGSGYKMINMGELFSNGRIYDIPMELVPLNDKEKEVAKVERYDLLFARQSLVLEGAGKCSIVMDVSDLTTFESHLIRVRLDYNIANPLFYYYYFSSSLSPISSIVSQCAQAGIKGSDLVQIMVDFPPLHIQHRIATILSSYDSLIENYQKQIKLLEESAQRLYKEWFVDLRFPGHENVQIVDGVPEGWEKKKVGDLISKVRRTKQVSANNYLNSGYIPVIDQSRNYIAGYTNDIESLVEVTIPYIVFGDHTRVLKYVPFSFAKGADGTQLIMSNDLERMPQSLFYNSIIEIDLSNYSYARHFKYLKEESILVPSKDIAQRYDKVVSQYFQSIQKNREQIRHLTEARDRLLPKLMSGEVIVNR